MKSSDEVDQEYKTKLLEGIWEQQDEMYEALKCHEGRCLCRRLAVFVLREVDWTAEGFIAAYEAGVLSA